MLDPEVVVNLLPELGVGVDLMMRGHWPGETFVGGTGWSVQLASFVSALGSETNEFHKCLSIFLAEVDISAMSQPKAARVAENRAALIGDIPGRADSIDYDAINHTEIAHVCVINTHVRAGFDRGSDHFARLVHNVTRPVENVSARNI
jgi:hypothetical protein